MRRFWKCPSVPGAAGYGYQGGEKKKEPVQHPDSTGRLNTGMCPKIILNKAFQLSFFAKWEGFGGKNVPLYLLINTAATTCMKALIGDFLCFLPSFIHGEYQKGKTI